MPTTFNAIYLGSSATQLDPTEGNTSAENAGSFVGQTFGSGGDPLLTHVVSVSTNDLGGTSGALDQNNSSSNDTFTTDLGSGTTTQIFDATAIYNATITYTDGTTATVTAVIVQDTAGNLFLFPETTNNGDTAAYEAQAIESITLNSVSGSSYSGATANRYLTGFDDGVVDGTAGNDVIDSTYQEPTTSGSDRVDNGDAVLPGTSGDDDYIDAMGGNDTVYAGSGDDTVLGGAGADSIEGGAGDDSLLGGTGDDTIVGGSASTATAQDMSLNWSAAGADEADLSAGFTQNAGGVNVSVSFQNDGNAATYTAESTDQIYVASGEPYDPFSSLSLGGGATAGDTSTTTIDFAAVGGSGFSSDVTDVEFRLSDLDSSSWIDLVTIRAYDADGNLVPVSLTYQGTTTTGTSPSATGSGSWSRTDAEGSVLVSIPGPVSYLEIDYDQGGNAGQFLWVSDIHFTAVPDTDGNDTIDGGAGADSLSGGDGDDTFVLTGTYGDDTIVGGEAGETNGDTIDASALTQDTTLTYTSGEAGTLADGTSTATFSEIEAAQLGSGDDTVDASATTTGVNVDAGAGDDSLTGGSGADTLAGGTGADTLAGGAGDDTLDLGAADGVEDLIILDDGSGNDVVIGFETPIDNGDGTFTGRDLLDVSDLRDANGNPVNIFDVTVTDTVGDGTGDAVLVFPNGERLTLAGVSPSQVDSGAELQAIGIPCFTRGTYIATPEGEIAIEDLKAGDKVNTLDHGPQEIRWIGSRKVAAVGPLRPVLIRAGALGNDRDLLVSQQHRMLLSGWTAELLFGTPEVLAAAKHLVDGKAIRTVSGGEVEYFHMLFDQHEIVMANGAPSESFHPGEVAMGSLDAAAREEVFALFPELRDAECAGYGPTARQSLKAHEAELLRRRQTASNGGRCNADKLSA